MNQEASPPVEQSTEAGIPQDTTAEQLAQQSEEQEDHEQEQADPEPPKKEPTPEEREIRRLRRRVDNLTKRLYQQPQLTERPIERDNDDAQRDNEPLSLSRQELQSLIEKKAKELAPQIKQQEAEIEHRRSVVTKLAKSWGQEKFDAYASDLDAALDGLKVAGRPKPAVDAIFEAEDAAAVIEYLADPDHAEEAAAIGRMSAVQAGRAVARLETKLATKKAETKPQPSKAPAPIEPARGGGTVNSLPSDSDSIEVWVKKERARLAAMNKRG